MAPKGPAAAAPSAGTLKLPVLVFGIVEVRRLRRELEALEDFMSQAALREPGKQVALPRVSRLLDALAAENHLNLLQPDARKQLRVFLGDVEHHAPKIHMSFATDPSSAFTAKIVAWLRGSIAPDVLLEVGLQPTIAAGAIVRTTNKVFDLSLRQRFADSDQLMLEAFDAEAPTSAASAAPANPVTAPQPALAVAASPQPVAPPAPAAQAQTPQVSAAPMAPSAAASVVPAPAPAPVPAAPAAPAPAGAAQ